MTTRSGPPDWAWDIAMTYPGEDVYRWLHMKRAYTQATRLRRMFDPAPATTLETAALLHDIGYSSELVRTGFHPLDGAIYLRSQGIDEQIVSLVAHHSCAEIEAEVRGLGEQLAWIRKHPDTELVDSLIWCDMTSGPIGNLVDIDWRLADIFARYGPDSVVGRCVSRAEPQLRGAWAKIEARRKSMRRPAPSKPARRQ